MKRRLASVLGMYLVLPLIPSAVGESQDKPKVVQVPPASSLGSVPVPPLSAADDERVRFFVYRLQGKEDEKLALLPAIAGLYANPLCADIRRDIANRGPMLVDDAVRAMKFDNGTYTPPSLIPVPFLSEGDPLEKQFKGQDLDAYKMLKSHAKEIEKIPALARLLDKTKNLTPFVGIAKDLNVMAGQEVYKGQYYLDSKALGVLMEADARCRPVESPGRPFRNPDPEAVVKSARILFDAAKKDDALADTLRSLGFDPTKSPDQLAALDPALGEKVKQFRSTQPGEASKADPIPSSSGSRPLTEDELEKVRLLMNVVRRYQDEDRRLATEERRIQDRPIETPADAQQKAAELAEKTETRLRKAREAHQMAGLALDVLANLGVDRQLVRDLSLLTNSGFQVAEGIIVLSASLTNPVGWLNVLSGLTSLLGGFGPDPNKLILEQLREIRRELAEFRQDVRVQFALLRADVLNSTQKLLDRVEDLEYNLLREIGEVKAEVRWNEYRLGQVDGQIAALSHQILTRFAELHQKDLITLLAARDLNPAGFARLNDPASRTELLVTRYEDAMAATYAAAVHHAASRTLAGGDFEVPAAYGTAPARLGNGGAATLIPLVQNPTAPWSDVNDFVALARSAGIDALPPPEREGQWPPATSQGRLGLPPDHSRLVNPLAWGLAASAYIGLANDCPDYFKSQHGLVRGLTEIYLRGEEFNDAANRFTDRSDTSVFRPLVEEQLDAIDRLEAIIKNDANKVAIDLLGVDPWHESKAKQPPPDRQYVDWAGPSPDWLDRVRHAGYDGASATYNATTLPFADEERLRMVADKLVPSVFCLAHLVRPDAGKGGSQSLFGGSIELRVVDVDLPEKHMFWRGSRRESTGFFGTGPGKYHGQFLYDGPVWITFEARYKSPSSSYDYPIFRKQVPTRENVQLMHDDERGYVRFRDPGLFRSVFELTDRYHWQIDPSGFVDAHRADQGFSPSSFVAEKWAELKADLFAKQLGIIAAPPDVIDPGAAEKQLEQRLENEVFTFENAKDEELRKGLLEAGDKVREVVGSQWVMLRFVQLAMPEAANDSELFDLLLGADAAWGGSSVMRRLQPDGQGKHKPLVVRTVTKDGAGKDVVKIECPLTQAMRAQTLKLEAKLSEVLARHQGRGQPFRHPAVEGTLLRIVLTARQMNIDLEKELADAGVKAPSYWAVRQVNDQLRQFHAEVVP